MARNYKKRNYWVERLTLINVISFYFQLPFSRFKVFYDEHTISGRARVLLDYMENLGASSIFIPASLLLEKKDERGYAVNYRLDNNIRECAEAFCGVHLGHEGNGFRNMVKQYLIFYLYSRFVFITMVEEAEAFKCSDKQGKNVFVLAAHPLNYIITAFYKIKGYSFKTNNFSLKSIKYYLRPLYHVIALMFARLGNSTFNTSIKQSKPSIWIEYSYGSYLDLAFWKDKLNRQDIDIVYYLDRDDDPPIQIISKSIEENGFHLLDMHFKSLLIAARLNFSDICSLMKSFFLRYSCPRLWFKIMQFEYKMWLLLYRNVFDTYKAKVLIQHQEWSWVQEPQARAIESVGGIMVGFHWSQHFFYTTPTINPAHVMFVWGKVMHDCFKAKGSTNRYILPSGLWLIPEGERNTELGGILRDSKFVINIFDNTSTYNCFLSRETLIMFYKRVLSLLENNPGWKAIIKSKNMNIKDFTVFPEKSGIQERINKLVDSQRLAVLDPLLFPSEAAKNAHISLCYGISSAGVIAGLFGHRFVQWDSTGCLSHPFYKDKTQKFTYPDIEAFENAVVRASQGDAGIGDFSCWRKPYNHFDDFAAAKRVGNFMRDFIQEAVKTNDAKLSLDLAANKYIRDNEIDEDFFKMGNYWDN